jgi:hypothetical protein
MSQHQWNLVKWVQILKKGNQVQSRDYFQVTMIVTQDTMTHPTIHFQNASISVYKTNQETLILRPRSTTIFKKSSGEYWIKYLNEQNSFQRFQVHLHADSDSLSLEAVLHRLGVVVKEGSRKRARSGEESQVSEFSQATGFTSSQQLFSYSDVVDSISQLVPDLSPPIIDQETNPAIAIKAETEWLSNETSVIEKIVDKRRTGGKTEYFIKWVGWGIDYGSWKEYHSGWDTSDQQKALEYERELMELSNDSGKIAEVETQESINTLCETIPWTFCIDDISNQQLQRWIQQPRPNGMRDALLPLKDSIIQLIAQRLV